MAYDVEKSVRIVKDSRKSRVVDKVVIFLFRKVFLSWCDAHLGRAYEFGLIGSDVLHLLDAQMKGDLGYKGYLKN
jgi:hypothetical protein